MRISFPKSRWWLAAGALLGVSILFQNCTAQKTGQTNSESKSTSPIAGQPVVTRYGGDGVDGKTYAHLGTCRAELAVDTRIFVSNDLSIAYVVKENCKDLDAPYTNRISEISVRDGQSAMIVFPSQNMILEAEPTSSAGSRTVLLSCRGENPALNVAVTVWKEAAGIFAQAIDQSTRPANDTGTVPVAQEQSGYSGVSEAAYLNVSLTTNTSGTVAFSSSGGSIESQNIDCASATAPDGTTILDPPGTDTILQQVPPYGPTVQSDPTCGSVMQDSNSRIFHVDFAAGSGNGDCIIQVRRSTINTEWITVTQPSCDQDFSKNQILLLPDNGLGFWGGNSDVRLVRASDGVEMCDFSGALRCSPTFPSPVSTPMVDENCDGRWDDVTATGKYN